MMGLTRHQYWLSSAVAAFVLLLVLLNAFAVIQGRKIQRDLNANQQFINETIALSQIYSRMAQRLGQVSLKENDKEIRALLLENGLPAPVAPSTEDQKPLAKAPGGVQVQTQGGEMIVATPSPPSPK